MSLPSAHEGPIESRPGRNCHAYPQPLLRSPLRAGPADHRPAPAGRVRRRRPGIEAPSCDHQDHRQRRGRASGRRWRRLHGADADHRGHRRPADERHAADEEVRAGRAQRSGRDPQGAGPRGIGPGGSRRPPDGPSVRSRRRAVRRDGGNRQLPGHHGAGHGRRPVRTQRGRAPHHPAAGRGSDLRHHERYAARIDERAAG